MLGKVRSAAIRLAWLVVALPISARPRIELGPSDGLSLDQPRVTVEIVDEEGSSLGPEFFSSFLLDTGAERIVIAGSAFAELDANGYQTDGKILEQGVGGFTSFDLSVPYRLNYAGTAGAALTLEGVRALSNPDSDFGSFGGILGMPGMEGRVTQLDFSSFGSGDLFNAFIGVEFPSTMPESMGHRYTVPLELIDFPLEEPDPPSTASGIPFLTCIIEGPVRKRRGRFLLDTGAQASILSERLAFALGLDSDGDGNFDNEASSTTQIGGVGGAITVPILDVGSLVLPTAGGTDLAWTNVSVIVLEIHPLIDGVFGSDLLTSGWIEAFLNGEGDGLIQQAQLDFRSSDRHQGFLALDITPALDTPAPGLPPVDLDDDHIDDEWECLFSDDLDAPLGDTDSDHLPLQLEHALNTDPDRHDPNPLQITRERDGSLSLRHPRNRWLPFISLVLESAPNLAGPWAAHSPATSSTRPLDALTDEVMITIPAASNEGRFFRLRTSPLPAE